MSKPKRPRSHELETESLRAFESALPPSLVVRPASDDYGIDREVEVFEGGVATGLTFKVQLKGTDGSGATRRVRREALNYWLSLDVPVLVVAYEASTQQLRCRWAHSIGSDGPDTGAKKVTIRLPDEPQIDPAWANGLAEDLRVVRGLRSGQVYPPTPLRIVVGEANPPLEVSGLAAEVVHYSRRSRHPLKVAADEETALEITIMEDRVAVSLPLQWSTATAWGDMRSALDDPRHGLGRDLLLLAASTFAHVNDGVAAEVAVAAGPETTLWGNPEIAARVAHPIAQHGYGELLLAASHGLSVQDDPGAGAAADILLQALHPVINDLDPEVFATWARSAEDAAHEDRHHDGEKGRHLFNLAHLLRARREFEDAVRVMRDAIEFEPRYDSDVEAHHAIAASLWELERYEESAEEYLKTIGCGGNAADIMPLLADSLMFAGRYRDALVALAEWEPGGGNRDPIGVLRTTILTYIVEDLEIERQHRHAPDPERIDQLAAAGPDGLDQAEVVALARSTDVLDPRLMDLLTRTDEPASAFHPTLIAASMLAHSAAAWSAALITALISEQPQSVVTAILEQGRSHAPDEFYEAVGALADHQEPEEAAYLRALLAATYEEHPVEFGTRLRWIDPMGEGDWVHDEIWLGLDAPGHEDR